MSSLTNIFLPLVVSILLVWFTYLNINYFYNIHKLKKEESDMKLCNTPLGIVINYLVLLVYVLGTVAGIAALIYFASIGEVDPTGLDLLNVVAILALLSNQYFNHIVYFSDKSLIVGRAKFDYRKIKRIQFKPNKITFNYGQNHLSTRLFFVDEDKLKVTLKRRS